jgi:HSP20 family protein
MSDNRQTAFRGLFDMFAEMGRMREHLTQAEPGSEGGTQAGGWIPVVDIYARREDLVLRCELAGVPKQDVAVSLCSGQLSISGERSGEPGGDDLTYYVRERRYGPFRRTITLPPGIESDHIGATIEDGLLEIVIRGGAAGAEQEEIEIAGAEGGEVRLDVR